MKRVVILLGIILLLIAVFYYIAPATAKIVHNLYLIKTATKSAGEISE